MDEYLTEKEQWDRVTAWLRENGLWIVAGVIVGAAGIGGWQWWTAHVDKVDADASEKYEQLQADLGKGDQTGALILMGDLERDYGSTPYVDQGHLALARSYVDSNQLDKATTALKSVIDHSKDKQLALVARVRLARVQIAQQKPDDALASLEGIDPGAFGALFHEVRGDAEFAKGNKPAALSEYRAAKTADIGSSGAGGGGGGDSALLDLKIADLTAATAAGATAPSVPSAAAPGAPAAGAVAPAPSAVTPSPATQAPAAQNQAAKQ